MRCKLSISLDIIVTEILAQWKLEWTDECIKGRHYLLAKVDNTPLNAGLEGSWDLVFRTGALVGDLLAGSAQDIGQTVSQ